MITAEQIQRKIAEAIEQSDRTQSDLAKQIGVSQSEISHYIKGDRAPALDTLANLCKVLDVDVNDIFCLR